MATMTSMWVQKDVAMGATYVDTVMASMSLISLGPTPMAVNCPMTTVEDISELED